MGILEKISEIEKEIARTQKNKGKLVRRNALCDRTSQVRAPLSSCFFFIATDLFEG